MIYAIIYYNKRSLITGFKILGHANYSVGGQDIVCAGVSALSINTVNSLVTIAEVTPMVQIAGKDGGLLDVKLNNDDISKSEVQILLKSLVQGITDINLKYKDYVNLKKITKLKGGKDNV